MKLTRRQQGEYEIKVGGDMILTCKDIEVIKRLSYGKRVILKKPVKLLRKGEEPSSFSRDLPLFIDEM